MDNLLVPLVVGELLAMAFIIFKTYPSMQTKVSQLEDAGTDKDKRINDLEKHFNEYNVELGKIQVEIDAFKKEYKDNKEDMKEILKELRKSLDEQSKTMAENSRAITSLEVTIKHFSNTIGNTTHEENKKALRPRAFLLRAALAYVTVITKHYGQERPTADIRHQSR